MKVESTGFQNSFITTGDIEQSKKLKRTITMIKKPKLDENEFYQEFMKSKKTIDKMNTIKKLTLPENLNNHNYLNIS